MHAVRRAPGLRQLSTTEGAYATIVRTQVSLITALNEQIATLQTAVDAHFGRHPAAEIYLSQPGSGVVLAARTLGEFGDAGRFVNARARKNYSGQSPITRASGKKTVVLARYATNRRLGAALHPQVQLTQAEMLAALEAALAELPYRQRACWILREIEGLTPAEIGQVLNLSDGAVRGQLQRGRRNLVKRMARWR